jgi:hypothetical protein
VAAPALPEVAPPWSPCHRLVGSRYPTVGPFDAIADPADLDVVYAIEGLTNPRLRQEFGELALVAPEDRIAGPGATLVMAAFTHLNPLGSRFSDGSHGVYYAAESLETAAAEVGHHRALFLARTQEPEIDLDLSWIVAELRSRLVDLRGQRHTMPAVYDPVDYAAGQSLGRRLRAGGAAGVLYHSVRREGGQCVALLKPTALARARIRGQLGMHWNGQRITHWYAKGDPQRL